ncbi:DUF6188 family protein [Cupriavidus plantarum]|uniref:DUF6188 family protein n=1 Tax=Cupriavidus plantarum TaxID=942865 RepID=UPI0011C41109|nr:DUF6188 family protein [Cupriavidus plantarum]NYI01175.1 hypothetical protein [Cupriavidus plantarum]
MIDNRDLAEIRHTILTGVTVGVGSLVLLFSSGAQIVLQCVFECQEDGIVRAGHGEDVSSSPVLFGLLNRRIVDATVDGNLILSLHFEDGGHLRIAPERNGLESYVLTTRYGIRPIVVI